MFRDILLGIFTVTAFFIKLKHHGVTVIDDAYFKGIIILYGEDILKLVRGPDMVEINSVCGASAQRRLELFKPEMRHFARKKNDELQIK